MVRDQLPIVKLGKLLPQPYKNGIYKSADFYGDGTQILRITDFDNEGHLVTDELQCLHLENNEVENYKLTSRDIVINRVNSLTHIGKSILWLNNTDCTTVYESNMMRIQPDESAILPEYLIRILQSEPAREHFRKVAKRAVAQCSINQQDVKSLSFPLHPLPEQKKIAQILSTWDRAISSTEQLLANSQQQKKALMQQLLTGQKRLLDNNGVRFSGDWKQVKLSKIFERVTTKNNEKSSNVVTISGQQGLIRQEDFFKKSVASDILDGYFLLMKGQFAYNKSYSNGYPMGAIKRLNRYADGVVTTLYICFEISESTKANGDFWEHYFESGLLNKGLSQIAHEGGRAHGLLNVKPTDFFSLKVPLPSLDEQQKIAAVLSIADQEITALQQKLAALKKEKKALMQQLLTGKRRVLVS
ncbi:restriction endonuclease subunit S [Aeromonas sobria]|uniref:restriction endonuclease subunit S n=1 Tax=Aeromonas sobria TaxID=646 RepID=UPI0026EDFB4C|nr:restriction endonuclease subunit S [Aeromonas sobria]